MKVKIFILFLFFLALTIYLGNFYRPFIYLNNIDDYGLADVGYNIIAVTNMSLLSWTGFYKFTKNKIFDIAINTLVFLSYEILSYFFSIFGVFDIKDFIALIFSSLLSLGLLFFIDKKSYLMYKEEIQFYL